MELENVWKWNYGGNYKCGTNLEDYDNCDNFSAMVGLKEQRENNVVSKHMSELFSAPEISFGGLG